MLRRLPTRRATPPAAGRSSAWTCAPTWPRITAPTLVISGADDLATPVEHQRADRRRDPRRAPRDRRARRARRGRRAARRRQPPDRGAPGMSDDDAYEAGHARAPRGAGRRARRPRDREHDGLHARRSRSSSPATRGARVWTRDGLDRRTRSAITLAVLTALGPRAASSRMHVRAARRNGLTPEEIGEVLLHTAVYAGVPAANAAFAIAQRVLGRGARERRRVRAVARARAAGDPRAQRARAADAQRRRARPPGSRAPPRGASCSRSSGSATCASPAGASRSRRACSSSATRTCRASRCRRSPSRTSRRSPSACTSPRRSRSSTATTSSTSRASRRGGS